MENIESVTEEKEAKMPFYAYRGVAKCFSAGISFLTDNFLFLLKVLSPVIAVEALLCVATMSIPQTGIVSLVAYYVMILLVCCVEAVVVAMLYRLILQDSLGKGFLGYNTLTLLKASRKQIKKSYVLMAVSIVVCFVCYLPSIIAIIRYMPTSDIATQTSTSVVYGMLILMAVLLINMFVMMLAVLVPFLLLQPYVMLENGSTILSGLKNAWKGFKQGYSHWGKCFGLFLLEFICLGIVIVLMTFPSIVMMSAEKSAAMGAYMGDAVNLPAGFYFFFGLSMFFLIFVAEFIAISFRAAEAYLYASVKHDEKEILGKEEMKEII